MSEKEYRMEDTVVDTESILHCCSSFLVSLWKEEKEKLCKIGENGSCPTCESKLLLFPGNIGTNGVPFWICAWNLNGNRIYHLMQEAMKEHREWIKQQSGK